MTTEDKGIAERCVEDLQDKLEALLKAGKKMFWVYSEADLMNTAKGLSFPATGVVYEGMRAVQEGDKPSMRRGASTEIICVVALIVNPDMKASATIKTQAASLLDDFRGALLGTTSPTGHLWRFVVEAQAQEKDGTVVWIQRWSTPAQITPIVR